MPGTSTAFALDNLQKRGDLFIGAGEVVYEGMIIGEASRPDEMVVNAARPKQLTNIRTHASDEAINLRPPRELTLETAIEWIADDELVEVTPTAIRVRKRYLIEADRRRYGEEVLKSAQAASPRWMLIGRLIRNRSASRQAGHMHSGSAPPCRLRC